MEAGFTRQAASIAFVFVLLAALWLIRRRGASRVFDRRPARRTRSLHAVERLALTPQHSLHLLRVHFQGEGRELVVATHPEGCTMLLTATILAESVTRGASKGAGA